MKKMKLKRETEHSRPHFMIKQKQKMNLDRRVDVGFDAKQFQRVDQCLLD